jgi:hypothetical protein
VTVVHLGVDLGSTALRAAYAASGDAATTVTLAGAEWPWLLCEPAAGGIPVSFPSVKSRLGGEPTESGVDPAAVVAKALGVVRAGILREPGTSIGHTVISVPARFFTAQRSALLAAADDAGLTDVRLITDTVAAVVQQSAGTRTGTYLVYGMGYGGCEFGLVRTVRGTYRVLGYEGAATPDGATLDALILRSWLTALRQQQVTPHGGHHGDVDWPRLRGFAEQVKLRLTAGESVLFPSAVPAAGGELHVQFDQSSFNRHVQAMVTGTLDRVSTLLTRADLNAAAVDVVTLIGGSTAMPTLREVVGGLGRPLTGTEDDHLALGALRHAHELGRRPVPAYDEPEPAAEPRKADQTPSVSPLAATVLTAPGHAAASAPKSTFSGVRQLISAGRLDAARDELRELLSEAQGLLGEIDAARSSPGRAATASERIAIARRFFEEGDRTRAIGMAHLAWQADPHDVDVFEEMLDLHCAAAMANPTIASFEADERLLRCALHHDHANARIRALLAERNYLQGRDLLRAGSRDEAIRGLQTALHWAPDHRPASSLLRESHQRRAP